jgi:NAD(P)-dependent dehydrogenase (short-subunit alcohol dehydrogenase family)
VTKNLSIELGKDNIVCMALHPGLVDTDMSSDFKMDNKASPDKSSEDLIDIMLNSTKEDNGKFVSWDKSELKW